MVEQLTPDKIRLGKLEKIHKAFENVENFWKSVSRETGKQLQGKDFSEAVGDKKTAEGLEAQFWMQLKLLCSVAIYQRTDIQIDFFDEIDGDKMHEKVNTVFEKEKPSERRFQTEMKQLAGDLDHLGYFWKSVCVSNYQHKTYSTAKGILLQEIEDLRKRGGAIDTKQLLVDLQFEALQGVWLTITRLNCVP